MTPDTSGDAALAERLARQESARAKPNGDAPDTSGDADLAPSRGQADRARATRPTPRDWPTATPARGATHRGRRARRRAAAAEGARRWRGLAATIGGPAGRRPPGGGRGAKDARRARARRRARADPPPPGGSRRPGAARPSGSTRSRRLELRLPPPADARVRARRAGAGTDGPGVGGPRGARAAPRRSPLSRRRSSAAGPAAAPHGRAADAAGCAGAFRSGSREWIGCCEACVALRSAGVRADVRGFDGRRDGLAARRLVTYLADYFKTAVGVGSDDVWGASCLPPALVCFGGHNRCVVGVSRDRLVLLDPKWREPRPACRHRRSARHARWQDAWSAAGRRHASAADGARRSGLT